MSLIKGLERRRWLAVVLAIACVTMAAAVLWQGSKLPAEASSDKQSRQERLHRGIGSEVRFASAGDSPEQVEAAVNSTDDFIYRRSGLKMSDKTRKDLAKAESDVLKGKGRRITLGELADSLTQAAVDRLATLTDEEARQAAEAASDETGLVLLRADGKWGALTKEEFIQQARSGREESLRRNAALGAALRPMIEEEVNDRAAGLSLALPEQFGKASTQGVNPTQALLIGYSVATDDPLTDSQSDIARALVQKRMEARQTREQKKAEKNVSGRPYGPHGLIHPSAAPLVFNRAVVDKLLNLSEGGKK